MAYLKSYQSLRLRLLLLFIFFVLAFTAMVGRLFKLSIVQHRSYIEAAAKQHVASEILPPERGRIFFRDKKNILHPAALSRNVATLVAYPRDIKDPQALIEMLAGRFGMARDELEKKLGNPDDAYEIIKKDLSDADIEFIRKLPGQGLRVEVVSRRIYPAGELGAGIIGFASFDQEKENGEYGIEKQYQAALAGEYGFFEGEFDAAGFWAAIGERILNPPVNGSAVLMTIDRNIQFVLEETLERLVKKWRPELGLALVLEPDSGKILALASRPTFNPNEYSKTKDYTFFRMPAIDSQFELGSVFKPITMAAALNEGVVAPATTYNDTGVATFGGATIKNFDGKAHGIQTMTQVLEKSLNTGIVWVEEKLGDFRFLDYIERFGFGAKSGIDFPGEIAGNISNLQSGRDIEFATAAFGQGIAVTPLQMAMAMGAIANGGVLMKPYIVEKIIDDSGNETGFFPKPMGAVIRRETSETLTKMLVSAVRNGFENRAGIKGYFVAGKTGTSQIPLKDRRGYSDEVIHTFVGYAPAFQPKFLILLQLNKPGGNRFASNTLTPAFHDLAEFILNYYEIPPDEK